MRVIIPDHAIDQPDCPMEAGKAYACEDQTVWEIAFNGRGMVNVRNLLGEDFHAVEKNKVIPNSILILRSGAAGDLLFLLPSILELQRQGLKVTLACMRKFHWIYRDFHGIELIDFPVLLENSIRRFERLGVLEYTGEREAGSNTVDLFAKALQLELADREPRWSPPAEILDAMLSRFPKGPKKRIGICCHSTSPTRNWDGAKFIKLAQELIRLGHEVAFIGIAGSINTNPRDDKLLINLTKHADLSWQDQIAFIKTCDLFVGNDGGNTHFSGAMGVSTIALYGPTRWQDRSAVFPSVTSIQGTQGCDHAPCYWHPTQIQKWPKDRPCERADKCVVLDSITPDRVLGKIKQILE